MESLNSKIANHTNNQEQKALELTRRLVQSQSKNIPCVYQKINDSNISINRLFEKNGKNDKNEFRVQLKHF